MFNKITNYIKESVTEIKKVTWPTRKETYNYTLLVIVVSLVMAALLGALDYVFTKVLELIISR